MRFVVITGMSGAGKSHALSTFEDLGYYCVDNMPVSLIPKFAELAVATKGEFENVALVTDIRSGIGAADLLHSLEGELADAFDYKIIFLEASTETLINRYKETRRRHPLADSGADLAASIMLEREKMESIREHADYIIDTTAFSTAKFREYLVSLFVMSGDRAPIIVSVQSFGYKFGIPVESDIVFDVRFLPNPYYEQSLRALTGLSAEVAEYVFRSGEAAALLDKLIDLFDYVLPRYVSEGKNSLVISIGCTGGKHRSVALAERIALHIRERYLTTVTHRDIDRKK